MKNRYVIFRKTMLASAVIVLLAGVLTACKKDQGSSTPIPAAGLMVFNLAPDQPSVGITLSGRVLSNAPLAYTSFNGVYQSIFTGNRDIRTYDWYRDSSLTQSTTEFQDSTYYSLFLVGNKGVYQNVVVKDNLDSLTSSDQAYIRYINAIPDSIAPVVTIVAGGATISSNLASFTTVSGFQTVPNGDVQISVANGQSVNASRTFPLEKGKVYTALLIGDPAAEDSSHAVQIRYIVNGTVTPS
jgi:hypothetical protein